MKINQIISHIFIAKQNRGTKISPTNLDHLMILTLYINEYNSCLS